MEKHTILLNALDAQEWKSKNHVVSHVGLIYHHHVRTWKIL